MYTRMILRFAEEHFPDLIAKLQAQEVWPVYGGRTFTGKHHDEVRLGNLHAEAMKVRKLAEAAMEYDPGADTYEWGQLRHHLVTVLRTIQQAIDGLQVYIYNYSRNEYDLSCALFTTRWEIMPRELGLPD